MAGFSSSNSSAPITGINVTPLVDITLVLLITFMVTAKFVVSRAMPMDLPEAATAGQIEEIFAVSLLADGGTFVDGEAVDEDALLALARAAQERDPELRAVLRADGAVPHQRVMDALDLLRQGGVARVAFAVEQRAPVAVEGAL